MGRQDPVKRIERLFYAALAGLFLSYLLVAGYAYVEQDGLLYQPDRVISATPGNRGLLYSEVKLRTKDGVRLSGWYVPGDPAKPPEKERGVVLLFHGNEGNISHRLTAVSFFHDRGLAVFVFDYRGYGKSGGSPSEEGTYVDAETAWDYLVKVRHIRPERIVLFGHSLGSAIATELALRRRAGALIIEAGFTSIPDIGNELYPFLPAGLISRFYYSTIDKVGKIGIPKLFIHSPQDEVVPFEQGCALYRAAAAPKEFLRTKGGHDEGLLTAGKLYNNEVNTFLSRSLPQ